MYENSLPLCGVNVRDLGNLSRSNELYTESSSPCHHQLGCENARGFQQSVRESIALNHLSVAQMHSRPHQIWRICFQGSDGFPLSQVKVGIFFLVLRSDVLGVEVFLFAPTVSGDDAVAHFCVSLSQSSPRFRDIPSKDFSRISWRSSFLPFFFVDS